VDNGLAWDKSYTMVFTTEGRMFVRTIKQYEQPYKNSEVDDIEPPVQHFFCKSPNHQQPGHLADGA
jgi:hypothetical protein